MGASSSDEPPRQAHSLVGQGLFCIGLAGWKRLRHPFNLSAQDPVGCLLQRHSWPTSVHSR